MKRLTRITTVSCAGLLALAALALPAAAASQKNLTKVFFLNLGQQPAARGKLMMIENKAQTFFKIQVKHMEPGDYDVVLDGAVVDTLAVDATGKARITYRQRVKGSNAGSPLPYHPAGSLIEIQAAGTAVLAAHVPATPEESFEKVEIEIDLANLGVVAGEAEAEFEERFGRMEFEVELEGVPPGSYELLVDGVKVADIEAGASGEGEVEFASHASMDDDDDDGSSDLDLLLTFDPRGKVISIVQAGVELFNATFPLTP
jgi:hypothetical protein